MKYLNWMQILIIENLLLIAVVGVGGFVLYKEITKKEYLNLICLIRIARALNKLAYKD